jgi:nitrogen fixation-related uncharacterized protein
MTIAMTTDAALLLMWVIVAFVWIAADIAVLVWAVRRGQFFEQDRARFLALLDDVPQSKTNVSGARPPAPDKRADHVSH